MSSTQNKTWLIAYDIREKRRLQRLHRYLKNTGLPLQYSVFEVIGNDKKIDMIMDQISAIADPKRDDVRAYYIPEYCEVNMLGKQSLPVGIAILGSQATRLLSEICQRQTENTVDIFED